MLGASSAIKLLIPMLAASAINAVQLSGSGSIAHAGWMILGIVGVQAAVWMLHGPGRVMERVVGMRVRANAADAIYSKLIALPLGWHEQHHSGEVQHRTQQATGALYEFTQNQFIYLQNAVNLVGPLVALSLISLTAGGVALAGYIVLAVIILRFDRAIMKLQVTENAAERRYVAGLLDLLGNVSTVLSLRVGAASRALLGNRLFAIFAPLRRNIVLTEAKWCAVDLLGVALCWSLVAIYAWQAHRGSSAGGAPLLIGSVGGAGGVAQASSIILLDEPTSALDQVTEGRVFQRLREQLPETTLIASVHRLSVLDQFDKVVLMAEGGIVDCGTAEELQGRQSLFRDLLRESENQGPAVENAAQTV